MDDYDCDQELYLLPESEQGGSIGGIGGISAAGPNTSGGPDICCATFPHMDMQGTVVKEKFCFPRTVLRNENDTRYLKPGQWNAYPLAFCDFAFTFYSQTAAALVAASLVLSMQFI